MPCYAQAAAAAAQDATTAVATEQAAQHAAAVASAREHMAVAQVLAAERDAEHKVQVSEQATAAAQQMLATVRLAPAYLNCSDVAVHP